MLFHNTSNNCLLFIYFFKCSDYIYSWYSRLLLNTSLYIKNIVDYYNDNNIENYDDNYIATKDFETRDKMVEFLDSL